MQQLTKAGLMGCSSHCWGNATPELLVLSSRLVWNLHLISPSHLLSGSIGINSLPPIPNVEVQGR